MARKELGRIIWGGVLLAVFMAIGALGAGRAMAALSVEYQGSFTVDKAVLWGPGRLATAPDGFIYVADGYRNHVLVFDGSGAYMSEITVPGASAVAVSPDGRIYVGSNKDHSVAIFSNGKNVGYLGNGAGEFSSVTDITVDDGNGNVYVTDTAANAVRVYNVRGIRTGELKGLYFPMGVAITGSNIYVLNSPLVSGGTVAETTVSEIAVFDKSGKLLKYFGEDGADEYKMSRPTDIAVWGNMVFVSDAARKVVLVYGLNGACLGEIQNVDGELSSAVSLALSREGTLYVSSLESRNVQVLTIGDAGNGASGN